MPENPASYRVVRTKSYLFNKAAASWFINGGKTPLKFGAISDWMEARDLPEADGESFRSWFKKHQAQEKKNG
ncbi:DUF3390 domain-containing protein [Escherichia coli]|nr:DUF3390 domain-containing protein [Escherichia coli]EHN7350850.1 DUF3390 domain-containing protein [Escherichia coli]